MNRLRNILTLTLFTSSLIIGASSCSQDETMDEIMSNTEINSPVYADDTTGNNGNTDKPGGN